jgi:hypothetical protein
MADMTGFASMTRAQAKDYLRQFLAEAPESLARLDVLLRAAGVAPVSGDLSPESLDRAWAGARTVLAWAPGYVPPPLGAPSPPPDRTAPGPPAMLPSWFAHEPHPSYAQFSADTLWVIDGLARHLAEVVLARVPGTAWAAGHSTRKGYLHEGAPVVTGLGAELNPRWTVSTVVGHELRGGAPQGAPSTIRGLYETWVERA